MSSAGCARSTCHSSILSDISSSAAKYQCFCLHRLRIMMKMHGLGDFAYYSVQYVWYMCLYIVYIIILLGIGSAVNIGFFRDNGYGLQIVRLLLRLVCSAMHMACDFACVPSHAILESSAHTSLPASLTVLTLRPLFDSCSILCGGTVWSAWAS